MCSLSLISAHVKVMDAPTDLHIAMMRSYPVVTATEPAGDPPPPPPPMLPTLPKLPADHFFCKPPGDAGGSRPDAGAQSIDARRTSTWLPPLPLSPPNGADSDPVVSEPPSTL